MAGARNWRFRSGFISVAGLLLLSLLWSLERLRRDLLGDFLIPANPLPYFESEAIGLAMLAFAAGATAWIGQAAWPHGRRRLDVAAVGVGLLVVPAGLVFPTIGWVSGLTRAALFALVPVFAVVLEPHTGTGSGEPNRAGLTAALVGLVGTLLVFPVEMPRTMPGALAFAGLVLAAGCVAWANCRGVALAGRGVDGRQSMTSLAAIAGAVGAIGLGIASAVLERPILAWRAVAPELVWDAAIELPALWLLFWLMGRMTAARMATRYLLALLLPVLVGAAAMRATLSWRTYVGIALMAAGAIYLLFWRSPQGEDRGLSLL